MKTRQLTAACMAATGVMGAAYLASAAMAQDEKPPVEMPPMLSVEQVKAIWPAGLQRIAGRYVFSQVASPGGLWESVSNPQGQLKLRQVSLNEVPTAFRQRLTTSEIVISDLQLPTQIEAAQRESPSKRGHLRFYSETSIARVTVKNLPGMAGREGDLGNFSGRVLLRLEHQSHSNPSVNGVLQQRLQGERTWGAATLDYADLTASTLPESPKPGEDAVAPATRPATEKKPTPPAKGTDKSKPAAPKPGAKEDPEHPEGHDGESIITNARVLRGAIEIFAFVEWETKSSKGVQRIYGTVRMLKGDAAAPPADPRPSHPVSARTE